ncbi:MAG: acyltransferase [Agathobacter sp.]|nr:acyltransferase [Agathobacter sp.]
MYNPFVGIYKFILALLVVAIHVEPFSGDLAFYINNCLARIAVPSFFVLSAYFLFDKLINNNWDFQIFVKNQKHLAKYYGIWLLLHTPVILSRLWETSTDIPHFIWLVIQAVCLKGPYGALWFLPATMLAVTMVYCIGKKFGPYPCLLISFPLFLFAALETEYYTLIEDIAWMEVVNNGLVAIFGWLANGLTFGFFFCSIGFYIAYTKKKTRNPKLDITAMIISAILLFVETAMIREYKLGVSYGAMLLLIPTVYYIVQILLHLPKTSDVGLIAKARYLQNMSLLIYPMHFAIMELMEYFLRENETYMNSTILQYFVVCIINLGLGSLILFLGEKKNNKIAKILYGKA